MSGLLGMFAPQPQQGGGLLGAMSAAAPQAPQGGGNGLQMAKQLAQNPTPEVAQQIIAQLQQSGNPEAAQFEQMIQKTGGDPAALKQLADAIVQKLRGGQ
ncbi:hypothetical protein [Massilia sp. CCM 8734]|uniref:hypothetical protein n=1 Tax=Massilia sp. CCM 8734 TaxID=2609283 RepID=UPI001422C824|nr:hypothetical protein [Massilia sp. CCM 8734]NHZ97476.1 hypothetical protein [Massilia sp. CCM 8734]